MVWRKLFALLLGLGLAVAIGLWAFDQAFRCVCGSLHPGAL